MDDTLLPLLDQKPEEPKVAKRRFSLARFFFRFLFFLVLLLFFSVAGFMIWLRTEHAEQYIQGTINSSLAPGGPAPVGVKVTSLSGDLPFSVKAGLELYDEKGLWLTSADTRFTLSFGLFPPRILLEECQSLHPVLHRIPILPEEPEVKPEPEVPMTPERLQTLFRESVHTLFGLPQWLPSVSIRKTGIESLELPVELLGVRARLSAIAETDFAVLGEGHGPSLRLTVPRFSLSSDPCSFSGTCTFLSGKGEESWLLGDLSISLTGDVYPAFFLSGDGKKAGKEAGNQKESAGIGASTGKGEVSSKQGSSQKPLHLDLSASGPLLAPTVSLNAALPRLVLEGKELRDFRFSLKSRDLDVVRFLGSGEKNAVGLDLSLEALLQNEPCRLSLSATGALLDTTRFDAFRVALSEFSLNALGLNVRAQLEALLAGKIPSLSGKLSCHMEDWHALKAFLPEYSLDGRVDATLALTRSGEAQNAALRLSIPAFTLKPQNGEALSLAGLSADCAISDLFASPAIASSVTLAKLSQGPLGLSLEARSDGSLTGPLTFSLASKGSVTTDIHGDWRDGLLHLDRLSLRTRTDLLADTKGPGLDLGIQLKKALTLAYGKDGIRLDPVELRLLPSGTLSASAALSPSGTNVKANLEGCSLDAFNALSPSLPKGSVYAQCALSGAAKKAQGTFAFGVKGLSMKSVRLAPMDIGLTGKLSGNTLVAALSVPRKTLQSIGGRNLAVEARIPLLVSDTGVPTPSMKDPLQGRVSFDGALAPLWKLVPVADQRLKGDLRLDMGLSGTLAAPSVKGSLTLANAILEDPVIGLLLRNIGLNVGINGTLAQGGPDGHIRIEGSLADGMGGSLGIRGESALDASKLAVTARLNHLRPLRRQDVRISLSGDVNVRGSAAKPEVLGTIVVDNGAVILENIEAGPSSVTTLPITEKKQEGTGRGAHAAGEGGKKKSGNSEENFGRIALAVKSPGRFLIDGYGLTSEWKTNLSVEGPLNNPSIAGEVSAVKGELDFLNKRFSLEKGIVTLAGGNVANPLIDMLLTNKSSDLISHIRVSGTVKKLKLSLSSEPEMPQDDVLAHILFGRNANELGRYEALQLAAAMGKMASGLGAGLDSSRKALGMDVMRLKQGESKDGKNEEGMSNMAVETGKYLTDSLYVGVEQGTKEGSTAGIIQYELTPKLKLELKSGQSNTQGSLNWKLDY
ncbi:MAG: translocation/assembly module TamB [Desulfovibrio sp.]|nr:translocation/assembly module TamB [Desulfovibrio sp.]